MIDERLDQISSCLYRVAAKAIVVRDNKILLTLELPKQNLFGVPGGGIEHGDGPRETIVRELREELNLDIDLRQISADPIHFSVGNVLTDDKWGDGRGIPFVYFYYRVELASEQNPAKGEIDFLWADLAKLRSLNFASNAAPDKTFFEKTLEENQ
jgi:ADP-ribose pyrophosphatase YjhB (NUDIX family)